jgi:hypothetical protein
MRIVFISINQGRQLFDPRGPAGEITFPMNCRGEIIPFRSDISRFSRGTGARNLREAGVDETVIMKIGGWKTRSVFIRYGIVATKDIENAMDLLQKNNGTLMEPDAKLAQR